MLYVGGLLQSIMACLRSLLYLIMLVTVLELINCNFEELSGNKSKLDSMYFLTEPLSKSDTLQLRQKVSQMFMFAYDSYIRHAFPLDELNPIYCTGRGPDVNDPSNLNINDVLGNFSLTLIDSLDMLAIMGNASEFKRAVALVIENVSFKKDSTIQVFEATIRIVGGLLSAHLLIMDETQPFGNLKIKGYKNELLHMAKDLADRLLPAFNDTPTGLPYPRVNLIKGVLPGTGNETCTAGAGSLLLEFGMLSKLVNNPIYEKFARRAVNNLWNRRSEKTGLVGNTINVQTGKWLSKWSGLGAGFDSFYEYLIKSYILFGAEEDLLRFHEVYHSIKIHMRRSNSPPSSNSVDPPFYVNVDIDSGTTFNTWIDSLQASFVGVQILAGDIEEAVYFHALHFTLWRKYGFLPERFNWKLKVPDANYYPLRPELAESTYLLYQATRDPFYLRVGVEIVNSIEKYAKAKCGYATVHNVMTKSLEDRMESFFLSETCKYLYLLFDETNAVNRQTTRFMFTTQGHILVLGGTYKNTSNHKIVKAYRSNETSANQCTSASPNRRQLSAFLTNSLTVYHNWLIT